MTKNIIIFKKFLSKSFGFTLIELLVVVGIISVMAVSLLVTLNPYTQIQKANDSKRKADLSQIQKALESYYQDKGVYPLYDSGEGGSSTYKIIVPVNGVPTTVEWGTSWSPYMNVLPKDPDLSKKYIYLTSPDGQGYYLYASLERSGRDPQACKTDGSKCDNAPSFPYCGLDASDVCNYGVSTPNVIP